MHDIGDHYVVTSRRGGRVRTAFWRSSRRTFLLGLCVGSASFGMTQAAYAQTASPPGSDSQLQDIVVTAQKREQSLQQVGITMQAVTSQQLTNYHIVEAAQLVGVVPGLNVGGANAGQTLLFGIRGVIQQDFNGSAESPVATYIDDGYFASNSISGIGLFDIDRVEVLKGPQGTLFGRNATGGVVNIFTKLPTDQFQGYAKLTGGSYGTFRAEAAVGGPISDVLKFRVAGVYDRNGGWVDNISPTGGDLGGHHGFALRGHLEYDPGTNFTALLSVYGSRVDQSWAPYLADSTRSIRDAQGRVVDDIIVNAPTLLGPAASDVQHLRVNANDAQSSGGRNSILGGTLKLSWDIGPQLVSITDYKRTASHEIVDDDATQAVFVDSGNNEFARNVSQEFRLYKDAGPFRWYGGLYYLHIHSGEDPYQTFLNIINLDIEDTTSLRANSYSAFGQVEYDFAPTLTAIGGFRVTKEIKNFDYFSLAYDGRHNLMSPSRTPYIGHINETLYSGKAQIEYKPNRDLLIYAGYNRGTKAGSFNSLSTGDTSYPDSQVPYKPETLHSFEGGEKLTFLNGTARFNSSVFYYDYRNYQAFNFDNLSTKVTNHTAHTFGAEAELQARPIRPLTIQASGSYTDNKVFGVDLPTGSFTKRAAYTSKWKGNLLARYDFETSIGTLGIQGQASYVGSFFYSITNYSSTKVNGYVLGSAQLSWTDRSKLWSLLLDVQNIGDKRYKTVGFDATGIFNCGCTQVGYGRPRWFTATLSRSF